MAALRWPSQYGYSARTRRGVQQSMAIRAWRWCGRAGIGVARASRIRNLQMNGRHGFMVATRRPAPKDRIP